MEITLELLYNSFVIMHFRKNSRTRPIPKKAG